MARSGDEGSLERGRVEHRAVDAQAHEALARRDDAAEAGAKAACHPRLKCELRRRPELRAQPPDRLEHRRRPARVHLDVLVLVELRRPPNR